MKPIIYQLFPRTFGNSVTESSPNGTIDQNGCGKFSDISKKVLSELRSLGITHIWYSGIINHATLTDYTSIGYPASHPGIVKGIAGSPYAIRDYYDVDPDLADSVEHRLDEFKELVERTHRHGMKVIIDFIPNHVSRDYHSKAKPTHIRNLGEDDDNTKKFSVLNNFYYLPGERLKLPVTENQDPSIEPFEEFPAKTTGNDVFNACPQINDWFETVKLNYGIDFDIGRQHFSPIPDTWKKMVDILFHWSAFGIDGFRCDMAGMVPIEFWAYAISRVKTEHPQQVFIAELYEANKYRSYIEQGGFDFLYDKIGMYDCLQKILMHEESSLHLSQVWKDLEGLDHHMLRFLENHDEQRLASSLFLDDPWKALPGLAIVGLMNNGPLMIYSGQELGEPAEGTSGFSKNDGRTSIYDYTSLPTIQRWMNQIHDIDPKLSSMQHKLRNRYFELIQLIAEYPVFSNGHFYDLMWVNEKIPERNSLYAFLRYEDDNETTTTLLVIVNFKKSEISCRVKIPNHAFTHVGFDEMSRCSVRQIYPEFLKAKVLLHGQIVSAGIPITIPRYDYQVYNIGY